MTKSIEGLRQVTGAQPLLGNMVEMQRDRMGFLARMTGEVDRIARVRGFSKLPMVAINHPDVLQELLVEKARVFEKSMMIRFALYPLAGEGLFTSRGDLWKRQRRLMAPLFHPARVAEFADDMVACADRTIDAWRDGQTLPVLRETTRITMSVAGKTLFQADTFGEADDIGRALTIALDFVAAHSPSAFSLGHLLAHRVLTQASRVVPGGARLASWATYLEQPLFVPGKEMREAITFLDRTVQRMIDTRRASPERHSDLMARLLEARDEDDGQRMSDKQVRDEVLTLFVAGHETTATALAWSIYLLGRHPAIYAAVEREVAALSGPPTYADLPRLPLTLRVFKEALRLYPPVYFDGRQAVTDTTLDGVACPEGTVALYGPYCLHRRPELWPDPERFDPDRFLPEAEAARSRYAWLPFGVGPRVCIGMGFALMEGQLVLARIIQRARFEVLSDETPEPSATLRPRGGVSVRVGLRGGEIASAS